MNLSYWEQKSYISNIDFTIVGSGIVGLNCALQLKTKYPKAKILILERGILPQGASTKNAGFACFGSVSEILSDLESHSETEVLQLVKQRIDGLNLLRNTLGDTQMNFQNHGGFELFKSSDAELYQKCLNKYEDINKLLNPIFKADVFSLQDNPFGFQNIKPKVLFNQFEGQIDTGKMMQALVNLVQSKGIQILNNIALESYSEDQNSVKLKTNHFEFTTRKLFIATNGFASKLIDENVKPARAQVLITKPIKNLKVKGTFHLDEGYYYFRNIDDRILLGGGRNLDFKGEETMVMSQTEEIQNALEALLNKTILPNTNIEIDQRWSGIMGVGAQKKPVIKALSEKVFCGVRLGGMGIAIGSSVGQSLANLVE
ncbi:FAD-dependent oxidoreductase [Winogradskyella maritima]|uniref:NAD(P)/FAD-dependent oxidoreductase n=1 Tax=Winogradskyella maritima TaxID=1517766 RepID=A0ABV8AI45_9FLAO|nr:FAD-dependent oxidoreductase [Winogradskyella maritima]